VSGFSIPQKGNMENPTLLEVLTREGVLINVSVRYWRATKKLKPEDLGLDPGNVTERLISLGHKKLLPAEALKSFALVESRAHALVEAHTFPFLNGLGHFLPNTKLEEVNTRLRELEQEFRSAQRSFLERYADLRKQASAEWLAAASKLVSDPQRLVATIEASFPTTDVMERAFGFGVQLFQIRVPESLDLELIGLGEQQQVIQARQEAAHSASRQISQDVQQFVGDCVAALRQQTAQLCEEMLQSMRSGKTGTHQRTLNRLVRFIDEFKQLNFVGDQEMEQQLERVRQEFLQRTAEDYRNDPGAQGRLQQGLQGLAQFASELAKEDTRELVERFGQMGQRKFHVAA
jgi:hypothetical protein